MSDEKIIGYQTCAHCKGSGKRHGWKCDVCRGSGKTPVYEKKPESDAGQQEEPAATATPKGGPDE
jgi:DnaJ-class molecular chaperone